jgi:uncharacterized protein with von Willebrand factor type A (vWA) domain
MKYVTHNTPRKIVHESYHFILLLDASGSMGGDRWNNLMEAVREFVRRRRELQTDDRITVIVFANKAQTPIKDQEIQNVDLQNIYYLDGGTSFKSAFACVNDCLTEFKPKISVHPVYEKYAIVFMSDGEDSYPADELDQILKAHDTVIKRFWTLALGDDKPKHMEVLENINDKMKGSFYDIATSVDLIQVYAEVATSTAISPR